MAAKTNQFTRYMCVYDQQSQPPTMHSLPFDSMWQSTLRLNRDQVVICLDWFRQITERGLRLPSTVAPAVAGAVAAT